MSLESGRKIHSRKWVALPIDDVVIDRVISVASKQQQPIIAETFPVFEWVRGLILDIPPLDDDDEWNVVEYDDEIVLDPMHEPLSDHHIISDEESISKDDDNSNHQCDELELPVVENEIEDVNDNHDHDSTDNVIVNDHDSNI